MVHDHKGSFKLTLQLSVVYRPMVMRGLNASYFYWLYMFVQAAEGNRLFLGLPLCLLFPECLGTRSLWFSVCFLKWFIAIF